MAKFSFMRFLGNLRHVPRLSVIQVLILLLAWPRPAPADPWPQWRGPRASGVSQESNFPAQWGPQENLIWQCDLPGNGNSSPIVWKDRAFLTADTGQKLLILGIDAKSGKILWEYEAPQAERGQTQEWNGYASSTPATDGEKVYAFFGPTGVMACSVEGQAAWHTSLGSLECEWGNASSPFLDGGQLYLCVDYDGPSFIAAINTRTGEIAWRTARKGRRGFSSPVLVDFENHKELVVNGYRRVFSYDPASGNEVWQCWGMTQWVTPTVVFGHGLIYAVSGRDGPVMAIRPGGKGDVTSDRVAWRVNRGAPYLPSPVLYGNYLYMINDSGIVTCLDAKSGRVQYQERASPMGQHTASPVAGDGKLYFLAEDGACTVVQEGPKFSILGRSQLPGLFRASPALSQGRIFLRSSRTLYCIGKP